MKPSKIWDFIGTNFISLATVLLGVIVIALDQLNVLPSNAVSIATLALLTLLATSEIVENRRNISKVDDKVESISEQLANVVSGIRVISFSSADEAITYVAKRTKEALYSIDQASLDYQRGRPGPARKQYEEDRNTLILADRIKYRYIGVLYSRTRLDRSKDYILRGDLYNYFVGFYPKPPTEIPLFNFVIIDKKEVFARYPFTSGQDPEYIVIRSPQVVKLFSGYFEKLWESSQRLENKEDYLQLSSNFE